MKIEVDFSGVDEPTAKQIDLVCTMCEVLYIDKPKEYTFEAYSEFIERYIDEFRCVEYEEFGRHYEY